MLLINVVHESHFADICQFLSSDKLGSLSHRDKKLVESLITRSKVQLQEISKIEKTTFCEEYVDMDAKKGYYITLKCLPN